MKKENQGLFATFENGVFYRSRLWFTDMNLNELFSYDPVSDLMSSVCVIKEEDESKGRLFGPIIPYCNEVILIPCSAGNVYRVNIVNGKYLQVKLDVPDLTKHKDYLPDCKFLSAFLNRDAIWMVGSTYPAIIKYDLLLNKMFYFSDWIYSLERHINWPEDNAWFRKAFLKENSIYAPCCKANVVLVFDIESNQYRIIEVGDSEANFSGICFDGKKFWLSSRHKNGVYRWNMESGKCTKLSRFPEKHLCKEYGYGDIVYWKEKIFLIPLMSNMICYIELGKNGADVIEKFTESDAFMSQFTDGKKLYLVSAESGEIIQIENENLWNQKKIKFSEKDIRRYSRLYRISHGICKKNKKEIFIEEYREGLFDFICFIEKTDSENDIKNCLNVGKQIHEDVVECYQSI